MLLKWSLLPIVWSGIVLIALAIPLSTSPLPRGDLANNLTAAAAHVGGWYRQLGSAFGPAVEYRPLLGLWIDVAYDLFGPSRWPYFVLLLLQYAAVLGLLILLFRPEGVRRAVAASVALACLVGLPGSRALLIHVPVNAPSVGLLLMLATAVLAIDRPTPKLDWLFLPLTVTALLLLESGVVMVPLVVVLLFVRARGVSWRGAGAMLAGAAIYMAVRRMGGSGLTGLPRFYTETGLGFRERSASELAGIFEHAPWLFWLYNATATGLTVLFSEPRQGQFAFVEGLLHGGVHPWRWMHVLSSTLTTMLIAAVLVAARPFARRDVQLIAVGLVLLVFGSGLGFLYTRDRIALTAGVGYAILAYVALAQLLERVRGTVWRQRAAGVAVAVLAAVWTWRTAETALYVRDVARESYLE